MPTTAEPIDATATETGDEPAAEPPAPDAAPPPETAIEHRGEPVKGQLIDPAALPVAHTAVGSAVQGLSVIPAQTEFRALAQLANTLAAADACPRPLRQKPNDVFLVLLTARDLGTAITTALREFHVIEGRVTLSPKVKLAMVRARPDLGRIRPAPDNNALHATWYSTRADSGGVEVGSTFSWDDAQLAGLVDSRCTPYEHWKDDRQSGGNNRGRSSAECLCKDNWKHYPQRMVSWRALGYLLDDEYPEIGTGLYSPDELGAVTDADGEPIAVEAVEALPGMKQSPAQRRAHRSDQSHQAPADDDPDAPATREDLDALRPMFDAARQHPDARQELADWWRRQELPKFDDLPARKMRTVTARVAALEAKYSLTPAPPADADETAQDAPPAPATAPEGGEAPTEPSRGSEAPIQAPEEQPADAETLKDSITGGAAPRADTPDEWVPDSPEDGNVAQWLIARAQRMSGADVKTAYTLADLAPPSGNVQKLRQEWALWQFELYGHGVGQVMATWAHVGLLAGFPALPSIDGLACRA